LPRGERLFFFETECAARVGPLRFLGGGIPLKILGGGSQNPQGLILMETLARTGFVRKFIQARGGIKKKNQIPN
jgi:hypothetical protein